MLFIWYCFDEWAAATFNTPWLANVPWPLILLLHVPLFMLLAMVSRRA